MDDDIDNSLLENMTTEDFEAALDTLVRKGLVTCECAFCNSNLTSAYLANPLPPVNSMYCKGCDMNIDTWDDILYKVVGKN